METLGINLISFVSQLVNFIILFIVLKKLVFQIVIDLIAKQRKQARDTEKNQQEIAAERENIVKLKAKELAQARHEAELLITKTKTETEKQKKTVLAEAEKKALRIMAEAKTETKAMETQLMKKAEGYSADLAVAIASKLIEEKLSSGKQQALIKKTIAGLKKVEV
jgi:F-type H+-transporting ATPase subunit b